MLHIAGGIILAVIILAFLPAILAAVGWLLAVGLVLGLAAGAIYLVFGTETGSQLATSLLAIAAIWFVSVYILKLIAQLVKAIHRRTENAGGWLNAFDDIIFELRPALTERQKVQKLAERKIRFEDAQQLKLYKQEQKRARLAERQSRERRKAEEAIGRQLKTANDRLIKDARRLERKFSGMVNLQFQYAPDAINVFTIDHTTESWTKVVSMRCKTSASTGTGVIYELEASPHFFSKGTETYFFEPGLIRGVRDILRRAAAETIAGSR